MMDHGPDESEKHPGVMDLPCKCRKKARKALQKLCKDNPTSFLPQRYLVSFMTVNHRHLIPTSSLDTGAGVISRSSRVGGSGRGKWR